jgi:hypothetical protein
MKPSRKRIEQENEIAALIIGTFDVLCESCSKRDSVQCEDSIEAASYFYEEGWRVKDERMLCRKCRRKQ